MEDGKKMLKNVITDLDELYQDIINLTKAEVEEKYGYNGRTLRIFLKKNGYEVKTFIEYSYDRNEKIVLKNFDKNKYLIDIAIDSNINEQVVAKILKNNNLYNSIKKGYSLNYKNRIIGNRYGKLVINSFSHINEDSKYVYNCSCDCGNTNIKIIGVYLTSGKKDNCGCETKKRQRDAKKKKNIYNLSKEFGIGYTFKNDEFYFDLCDYDLIKNYCWFLHEGYVEARSLDGSKKNVKMHRLIINAKSCEQIDHKNTSRNDNRRENLRVCTNEENARNKRPRKINKTGIVGVQLRKNGTYRVRIRVDKKEITIGHYDNIKDATKARLEAEYKYYKEFSPQYYLFEKYGVGVDKDE